MGTNSPTKVPWIGMLKKPTPSLSNEDNVNVDIYVNDEYVNILDGNANVDMENVNKNVNDENVNVDGENRNENVNDNNVNVDGGNKNENVNDDNANNNVDDLNDRGNWKALTLYFSIGGHVKWIDMMLQLNSCRHKVEGGIWDPALYC
ncbi:hypothetical protein LguiA_019762 [Lonicera macranthoides]